jgi:hypothetical protein
MASNGSTNSFSLILANVDTPLQNDFYSFYIHIIDMHKMKREVFKMHDKSIWINKDIQFLFNTNIVEYDMKAASVSVCEHDHLLNEDLIQQLKLMPKEQRTRKMGLLQRDDAEFSKKLLNGIKNIRRKFL